MARSKQTFKQADVTRAIKGARAAGMEPTRVEIYQDGRIVIFGDEGGAGPDEALDEWLRNRNARST